MAVQAVAALVAKAAVRQLTVTIDAKGPFDAVVVRFDEGTAREQTLLMTPSEDKHTWIGHGVAGAGDHWLTWFVRGQAGTEYALTLEGQVGGPWQPADLHTVPPGRDSGYQDFLVAAL